MMNCPSVSVPRLWQKHPQKKKIHDAPCWYHSTIYHLRSPKYDKL